MRRDREQGLGQLADVFYEEVLDILACQNNGGLLFADTFHKVSDILDRREVGEEKVEFVNARDRISSAQKLLRHISEDVEQQSVADIFACLEQSFYAERHEIIIRNIRVTVKEFALRTLADRVQAEFCRFSAV